MVFSWLLGADLQGALGNILGVLKLLLCMGLGLLNVQQFLGCLCIKVDRFAPEASGAPSVGRQALRAFACPPALSRGFSPSLPVPWRWKLSACQGVAPGGCLPARLPLLCWSSRLSAGTRAPLDWGRHGVAWEPWGWGFAEEAAAAPLSLRPCRMCLACRGRGPAVGWRSRWGEPGLTVQTGLGRLPRQGQSPRARPAAPARERHEAQASSPAVTEAVSRQDCLLCVVPPALGQKPPVGRPQQPSPPEATS